MPTSLDVFPNAASTALQYLSLTFPKDESWTRYNSLQQLTYFITVFVAAPVSIFTGLMQSPALSNHSGWLGKVFNRQRARSVHFMALWWFLLFILAHVTLVFITGARDNLNMMFAGVQNESWSGFAVFAPAKTVTFAGTVATVFALVSVTTVPPVGAGPERLTFTVTVLPPVWLGGASATDDNVAGCTNKVAE